MGILDKSSNEKRGEQLGAWFTKSTQETSAKTFSQTAGSNLSERFWKLIFRIAMITGILAFMLACFYFFIHYK